LNFRCGPGHLSVKLRCIEVFPNQPEDGTLRQASFSCESEKNKQGKNIKMYLTNTNSTRTTLKFYAKVRNTEIACDACTKSKKTRG